MHLTARDGGSINTTFAVPLLFAITRALAGYDYILIPVTVDLRLRLLFQLYASPLIHKHINQKFRAATQRAVPKIPSTAFHRPAAL